MTCVYILKCKGGKYYIGRSNNMNARIDKHFNSYASEWTRKYKPIEIDKFFDNCHPFDEDKYTLEYMDKYGVDNVRGGSFSRIVLSDVEKELITRMINTSKNNCYLCGGSGHFILECNKNKIVAEPSIIKKIMMTISNFINKIRKKDNNVTNLDAKEEHKEEHKEEQSKEQIAEETFESIIEEQNKTKPKPKYKCSKCKKIGHTSLYLSLIHI